VTSFTNLTGCRYRRFGVVRELGERSGIGHYGGDKELPSKTSEMWRRWIQKVLRTLSPAQRATVSQPLLSIIEIIESLPDMGLTVFSADRKGAKSIPANVACLALSAR
jgi:hypothetical protein